jgi:hypothetical protein
MTDAHEEVDYGEDLDHEQHQVGPAPLARGDPQSASLKGPRCSSPNALVAGVLQNGQPAEEEQGGEEAEDTQPQQEPQTQQPHGTKKQPPPQQQLPPSAAAADSVPEEWHVMEILDEWRPTPMIRVRLVY